jgi:hypothetical protein
MSVTEKDVAEPENVSNSKNQNLSNSLNTLVTTLKSTTASVAAFESKVEKTRAELMKADLTSSQLMRLRRQSGRRHTFDDDTSETDIPKSNSVKIAVELKKEQDSTECPWFDDPYAGTFPYTFLTH